MIQLGVDRLFSELDLQKKFRGKRLGLLAHPASVNAKLIHSIDVIRSIPELNLTCAFGPQQSHCT